jgi:hypothetical protein
MKKTTVCLTRSKVGRNKLAQFRHFWGLGKIGAGTELRLFRPTWLRGLHFARQVVQFSLRIRYMALGAAQSLLLMDNELRHFGGKWHSPCCNSAAGGLC